MEPKEPARFDTERFHAELQYLSGTWSAVADSNTYQSWHAVLQSKFTVHPSVKVMLERYAPLCYKQLALEFPHVSEKDAQRLAYTRTIADGANDRQLVTSVGKYLARHFPHIEDHNRRDVQAMYTPDTLQIFDTTPDIIRGVEDGPRSCMASVYGSIPFKERDAMQMRAWFADKTQPEPDWTKHPYSGYRPEYGWSIALRITAAGKIDGRALIYKHEDQQIFLRTYRRHPTQNDGWSETDFSLQEWLKYQGYKMVSGWPEGAKIHTPSGPGSMIFAPYIDGDLQTVAYDGDKTSVFADSGWTHQCTFTSGYPCERDSTDNEDSDNDENEYCDHCDAHFHSDDMCYAGRGEDIYLCCDCRNNDYTSVEGTRTNGRGTYEYYIQNDDAQEVRNTRGNRYIDPDYCPDDVVQLEDGDYAELDDTVCINDGYYLEGDYNVVYLQDNDDLDDSYGLRQDCYEVDGKWWASEEHWAEFHGPEGEDEIEPLTTTVAAVSDECFALAG